MERLAPLLSDPAEVAPPLTLAGSTADVTQRLGDPASFLSETERVRAARLHSSSDHSDFIAAHALVRVAAGLLLGIPGRQLTVIQQCDTCGGNHGRPAIAEFPALHVSLSHTSGSVAAVAGFGPVAVDVDRAPRHSVDPGVMAMALNTAESDRVRHAADPHLAFLRYWVRKESFIKLGQVTLDTLRSIDLSEVPIEPTWLGETTRHQTWQGWHLMDWSDGATGVVGTVVATAPPRFAELPWLSPGAGDRARQPTKI